MSMADIFRTRRWKRKQAYRAVFLDAFDKVHPNGEVILADLRRFCRAAGTTVTVSQVSGTIDPLAMALAEGRREVFNRIIAHLHLDDATVLRMTDPSDNTQ